ncbi:MAG TPA: porin family protein [Bacteroidales bacterium]|nr:porin family protein [Bacteroidales bacterium]
MKKIILVLLSVVLSTGAFAQFSWGLKAGASSNTFELPVADINAGNTLEAAKEATWGFHGGAFFRLSMLGIMVQPEVLFSMSENNLTVTDDLGAETVKEQKFNRLDVPVMLGVKLGPLRIMAGPVASVVISSPGDLVTDAENLYKNATFGYQAGLGVDLFKKLTLDVRYEGGLNNFGNEMTVGTETFTLDGRANAIVLSAGIMF